MNGMKNKIELICMFICGLSLLGAAIGMLADLTDTMLMICGIVMFVSMVILVYKNSKIIRSKN